ncbi:hypothetical protein [Chryseolinea sp. H1M3-3]|uniref:hypothetical protein n=1 Tax=Chryseolinea sp. H1M3-3 TaxID=3034144 RepID=UPI0023EDDF84|nr:hypothetical protein [Chryseolinea sp. H1M3-3]
MLKFLIITSLVLYLVYKVGALFFKAGAASQQLRNQQQKRSFEGEKAENPKKSNGKPGEYIDYEEIK